MKSIAFPFFLDAPFQGFLLWHLLCIKEYGMFPMSEIYFVNFFNKFILGGFASRAECSEVAAPYQQRPGVQTQPGCGDNNRRSG